MTEAEVVEWLGFPPGTRVLPEIIGGMRDVPAPVPFDDSSQLAAFAAFLKVAPKPPGRVAVSAVAGADDGLAAEERPDEQP